MKKTKRFRLDVDLDWATMTCPCGSSVRGDSPTRPEWEKKHAPHTDDNGKSYLEVWDPTAWRKCFSGPVPRSKVVHEKKERKKKRKLNPRTCRGCGYVFMPKTALSRYGSAACKKNPRKFPCRAQPGAKITHR